MEEVWKDIPNYEGLYQVSNLGRVRGLDRMSQCKNIPPFFVKGVELVLSKCAGGYFYCHLSKNNKKKSEKYIFQKQQAVMEKDIIQWKK